MLDFHSYYIYPSCLFVRGSNRALIIDTHFQKSHIVPLSLVSVVRQFQRKSWAYITEHFSSSAYIVLKEYYTFLIKEKIIKVNESGNDFGEITTDFYNPAEITNCILEFNENIMQNLDEVLISLDSFQCRTLLVIFRQVLDSNKISELVRRIADYHINCLQLILEPICSFEIDSFLKLIDLHPFVFGVDVYNSDIETTHLSDKHQIPLRCFRNEAPKNIDCGTVTASFFVNNFTFYSEAIQHNTCLNRKIAIDAKGNIKNCLSMRESFGNINTTSIANALRQPGFKKYWDVSKDQITVCKDCEFRYVCTDCRAYLENPKDIFSKPLKCGYNPYTCEWEEWSTHPMKQLAIDYYRMDEL